MTNEADNEPEDDHAAGAGTTPHNGDAPIKAAGDRDGSGEAATGVVQTAPTSLSPVVIIVAIVALLSYAGFIIYMFGQTDAADEVHWARSAYLFSGIESIAFAAAGFLFGREVNRARAENAESLARTEQKRANNATAQRDKAQQQKRELSTQIRDLADLTEEVQQQQGVTGNAAPSVSFSTPGSASTAFTSNPATPVLLNLVAKRARHLAERARRDE